jgi:hypothetical protein
MKEPQQTAFSAAPGESLTGIGITCLLLIAPWLNPYAAGPSPNVWPWLLSAVCVLALGLSSRRIGFREIALSWVFAASISALVGVCQYFGSAQILDPWVSSSTAGEAFANLRQRNQYATLTSIGFVALTAWLATTAPAKPFPRWAFLVAVALSFGNAVSSSRTGLLQWTLFALLAARWYCNRRRRLLMFVLCTLLLYSFSTAIFPWWLEVFRGIGTSGLLTRMTETATCGSRMVLWRNVVTLITNKPWFGWGWGELDYAHYMTLYDGPRFCEILDNAHNLPLHLAVELGIPVSLAVCGGFSWWALRQRPWNETDPARQMAWGVLAVILLHSMLEYPLWYGPFQMAFWLCIALLWRRGKNSQSPSSSHFQASNSLQAGVLRAGAATFFITTLAYAAMDYHRVSQIYLAPQERDAAYRENTLAKIRGSWLFRNQVRFAELLLTPLTRDNAQWTFDTATALLHFSPEPRVIEKVIESAVMLGKDSEALAHLARFKAAFPEDHARWARQNGRQLSGLKLQS